MGAVDELSVEECHRLLRRGVVGRVALQTPHGLHLVPLNYTVTGDAVVVTTSSTSLVGRYGRDAAAVFEIDGVEPQERTGWSVVVAGRLRVEYDPEALSAHTMSWDGRPWPEGPRTLVLRMDLVHVSGRRVLADRPAAVEAFSSP